MELYGIRGIANDLIKNYLSNRQQFVRFKKSQSSLKNIYCGVPQGSILGPLLFLLYINDITYCCKYLKFILFADDTNLLYSNPDFNQLINITNSELDILSDWFRANMLSLNVAKTNYMLFGFKKMQFSNNSNIKIDNFCIAKVEYTKFLGVLVDQKLCWSHHITHIASKIAKCLYILSRLRNLLSRKALLAVYYSTIYPHLNYCNILWGHASKSVLNNLIMLQKRSMRIICNVGYRYNTGLLFKNAGILKLLDINVYNTALFMFKYYHKLLPDSCKTFVVPRDNNLNQYNFRYCHNFNIPNYRTCLREKFIKTNRWCTDLFETRRS